VPTLIVVTPVKVAAAERVNVPAPSFVSVPVVVPMTPLIVVLPAPPTVNAWAAPPILAETVSVPPSELMRGVAPSVSAADHVLSLARLRIAPFAAMPVPMRLVTGSAMRSPEPSISMAAPDATVVPAAAPPRAAFD
jgi:hypothetical protein